MGVLSLTVFDSKSPLDSLHAFALDPDSFLTGCGFWSHRNDSPVKKKKEEKKRGQEMTAHLILSVLKIESLRLSLFLGKGLFLIC